MFLYFKRMQSKFFFSNFEYSNEDLYRRHFIQIYIIPINCKMITLNIGPDFGGGGGLKEKPHLRENSLYETQKNYINNYNKSLTTSNL